MSNYWTISHNTLYDIHYNVGDHVFKECYVELRPLSSITDEEIKDMCKNMYPTVVEGFDRDAVIAALTGMESLKGYDNTLPQFFENLDYLRSKGFLMPFMGISPEQWVEWGVVKLKTE